MGLLGKALGMLPNAMKGADEPGSPGMRLWLGHGTSSGAREFVPTMDPFMENRAALKAGASLVKVRQGDVVSWAFSTS